MPDATILFNDLLVISSVKMCVHEGHALEKINAEICLLKFKSTYTKVVPVFYCRECDVFYIMEAEFKDLKLNGYICCRTLTYNKYRKFVTEGCEWLPQSLMASYGYSISRTNGLSDSERYQILDFLAHNSIMSYIEQYDFIHWLVKNNLRRKEMSAAVEKWNKDREYLSGKFTMKS